MDLWTQDGNLLIEAGGDLIECADCPCDEGGVDCTPCCTCIQFSVTLDNGVDPAELVQMSVEGANSEDDCCCEYESGAVALPGGGTIALHGIMVRSCFYWYVEVAGSPTLGTFETAWKVGAVNYDDCCPDVAFTCINDTSSTCNDLLDEVSVAVDSYPCPVDCQINCDGCSDTYTLTATLDGWCSFIDISGDTLTRLLAPLDCEWESTGLNPWRLYCRDGRWYIDNIPSLVVECDIGTGSCPPTGSGSCLFPVGADCAGQTLSWTLSSP